MVAVGGGFAPHAERAFLTRHNFAKIPDALDTAEAATANIGLTALHAIRRAQLLPGETAAVIGMGLVGQMIAQMVRMMGGQAIGIDLIPFRLEKARELGIDLALQGDADTLAAAVADYTCGLGVDASFVAAGGGPEPGRLGIRLVRPSGRVMMIGGLVPDFTVAHPDANPSHERDRHSLGVRPRAGQPRPRLPATPAPTIPTASCNGTKSAISTRCWGCRRAAAFVSALSSRTGSPLPMRPRPWTFSSSIPMRRWPSCWSIELGPVTNVSSRLR